MGKVAVILIEAPPEVSITIDSVISISGTLEMLKGLTSKTLFTELLVLLYLLIFVASTT